MADPPHSSTRLLTAGLHRVSSAAVMKAVILAAGVGSRLAPLTSDRPKVLVEVLGRSFLARQLEALAQVGIAGKDVVVVGGYRVDRLREALAGTDATIVVNDKYEPWNNFYSVLVAEPALRGHAFLQLDGDTILDAALLPKVIAAPGDAVLAVDCRPELDDETMKVMVAPGTTRLTAVSKKLDPAKCKGEYIGITKLSAGAAAEVFAELAKFPAENLTHEYYEYAFDRLARGRVAFEIVDVHGCKVLEIDTVEDLRNAEELMRRA